MLLRATRGNQVILALWFKARLLGVSSIYSTNALAVKQNNKQTSPNVISALTNTALLSNRINLSTIENAQYAYTQSFCSREKTMILLRGEYLSLSLSIHKTLRNFYVGIMQRCKLIFVVLCSAARPFKQILTFDTSRALFLLWLHLYCDRCTMLAWASSWLTSSVVTTISKKKGFDLQYIIYTYYIYWEGKRDTLQIKQRVHTLHYLQLAKFLQHIHLESIRSTSRRPAVQEIS